MNGQMNAPRSGIPKVIGILMIIFASLGLLFGLIGLGGNASSDATLGDIPEWKTWSTLSMVFGIVGLGISGLHLFAGVSAVRYKTGAPKLAIIYAILNIVTSLIQTVLVFAWLKPALAKVSPVAAEALGGFLVIGLVIAMIWPIIVLSLMTRPGAKASCVN